jgi:hypothetical protein
LIEEARAAFSAAAANAEQLRQRTAELAAHEEVRSAARARLEAHRARKAVEDAVAAAVAGELAEAEAEASSAAQQRRVERARAMKELIAAYAREQAEISERIEAVRAEVEAAEAERRASLVAAGASRVESRNALRVERATERARSLATEAQALERERAALLERLVASVPYRERVDEIQAVPDAARAAGHTASSAASAALSGAYAAYLRAVQGGGEDAAALTTHDNLDFAAAASAAEKGSGTQFADGGDGVEGGDKASRTVKAANLLLLAHRRIKEQGLFPKHGFTDKQVTSDKRFRFVSAAWAAGIAGSAAAVAGTKAIPVIGRGAVSLERGRASDWTGF